MTQLLIHLFVRHPDDTKNAAVRTAYGNLASLVGMECRWVDTLPDFNTPARPKQSAEEIKARILAGLNGGDTP